LAADVEFFGGGFEFFEHGGGEVDVGEEAGDVSAVVGLEGDAFGGFSSLSSRSPRDRT
jgi:hypothetical protein